MEQEPRESAPMTTDNPMTTDEVKENDLRVVYGDNWTAVKVALLHNVPARGIALAPSGDDGGAISAAVEHDTSDLDTFIRLFRALMAFGLKVRCDETDDDRRYALQQILWTNFGVDPLLDQRVKSWFYEQSFGQSNVANYQPRDASHLINTILVRNLQSFLERNFNWLGIGMHWKMELSKPAG